MHIKWLITFVKRRIELLFLGNEPNNLPIVDITYEPHQ